MKNQLFQERTTLYMTNEKPKFPALKPRSGLQEGGKKHITSLIELAKEFVDDEGYVVAIHFPQLTLVSREKIYSPSLALTI
jgi:hypothetical protein